METISTINDQDILRRIKYLKTKLTPELKKEMKIVYHRQYSKQRRKILKQNLDTLKTINLVEYQKQIDYRKQYQKTSIGKYSRYRNRAKKKGRIFDLTLEQFTTIIHQPCHYCGKDTTVNSNGIDRRDNDVGYIFDNCLPACYECNMAKGVRTYQNYINWVQKVANHLKLHSS